MSRKVTYEYLDYVPKKQRAMSMKLSETHTKVNVGIQTIIPPRHYIPPAIAASHRLSLLDFPKVLYMPHTVFFTTIGLILFFAIGFQYKDPEPDFSVSIRRGLLGAGALLLFFSAFYLPDTLLNRPHPILWRIVQGISCAYLIVLVFMLFMDLSTAQELIKCADPSLINQPFSIAKCRPNLINSLDFSVIARTIGWCFKMLIFRNFKIVLLLSLLYGAADSSIRILLNIETCWKQLILFDFLLSSLIGIVVGQLLCLYLERHTQKWFGKKTKKLSTIGSLFEILHPNVWWNYKWRPFDNFARFFQISWLIFITMTSDLNIFFLRALLKLPSTHYILLSRALFLAFLAMISIKEYYEFINSKYIFRSILKKYIDYIEDFQVHYGYYIL